MAEKFLNSRIIQKHDITENWEKAVNFIPKQGEIIVYDSDSTHTITRFKIGDGKTKVNSLPFIGEIDESLTKSGLAADSKAVGDAIELLNSLVGETSVSVQIENALANVNGVPSSTTNDNGKFLRVVNGAAAWATIPNAEEASF